jgi:hypothetical protein
MKFVSSNLDSMGKTKGFIESKGSRRRVRVKTKGFIKPLALGWM